MDDASHDDGGFATMLAGALPSLQRLARVMAACAAEADDLLAEAIARTLPRWRAGQVTDPPAYLHRVLVNLARRRWRRRRLALRSDHYALDWLPRSGDDAVVAAERDRTLRAVTALPPRRRAVVVLRFYEDRSEAEIADLLGIDVGTVKSTLSRALGQLREALGTRGGV